MANINVSASRNLDDIANAALTNGATITINSGAVLTMNSDTRWSQRAAVPLSITIDASGGGELVMDGRDVWWLPYTAGSGTVPVLGTTFPAGDVTSGTASGEFLGVFTGLGVAPSSGTMPATGYIKLRTRTGDFANAQALSLPGGATATASGAGQRGWLNIVGAETGTITIPRLGKWTARGDWFDLGTTSGATGQTLQYYVADFCPALWIETSAGSGVYEIWLNAGDRWSETYVSQDNRGRFFGCTAAGVISLATTTFGKLPVTGCKIRVPNIHVSSTTSANYALNTLNATLGTRWETLTSGGGEIDLARMAGSGLYINTIYTYTFNMVDCAVLNQIVLSTPVSPINLTRVAVGLNGTGDVAALLLTDVAGGGLIDGCYMGKYTAGTSPTNGVIAGGGIWNNLTISNSRLVAFARANAGGSVISLPANGNFCTTDNIEAIGAQIVLQSAESGCLIKNTYHSDTTVGGAKTGVPTFAVSLLGANANTVDGVYLLPDGTPPYTAIVSVTGSGNKIRNVGTPDSRYDCGSHTGNAVVAQATDNQYQRIYTQNTRLGTVSTLPASSGNTYEHVWGDAGDAIPVTSKNSVIRGAYAGSSGFGASGIPIYQPAVYGFHFYDTFISATEGRIGVLFSEPTSTTLAYVAITGALFDGVNKAMLQDLSDQLTYTWPHFILGYTGLENVAPALSGTNTGNLTIEYDLDKGSGFSGTWQTCNAANLSAETGISATTGFKPMFRFTCATASTSNAINGFYITGTTDATSQQTQYPLDVSTLTLTGLPVAAEVRCYTGAKDGSAVEIGGVEATGGTTFTFTHSSGGSSGFIHIIHPSYKIKEIDYTYAVADTELLIQMDPDPWYSNPV